MSDILDQIDHALRVKKLSDARASQLAAGNVSLIKNIRAGQGNVGVESLRKLAEVLDLELYFGPPRDAGPVEAVTLDGAEFALIPLLAVAIAAGAGVANDGEEVLAHLAFRRDWLTRVGVTASQACLARVAGDSMAPTIRAGDLALIDTAKTDPPVRKRTPKDTRPPAIWAFSEDGEARVKRIERPEPGVFLLISDNPAHSPELRTGRDVQMLQTRIIGKVVWWGHTAAD